MRVRLPTIPRCNQKCNQNPGKVYCLLISLVLLFSSVEWCNEALLLLQKLADLEEKKETNPRTWKRYAVVCIYLLFDGIFQLFSWTAQSVRYIFIRFWYEMPVSSACRFQKRVSFVTGSKTLTIRLLLAKEDSFSKMRMTVIIRNAMLTKEGGSI